MSLASAPRFSIVVICRNEERALPRLLYTLEDFRERGGDVVLVDSGSTDETIAIARGRGCRVDLVNDRFDSVLSSVQAAEIDRRFAVDDEGPLVEAGQLLFHFGEARQYAAGLAANPFVWQLDASDQVLALDIDALDQWIGSQRVGAFEYDQLYGNVVLRIGRFYDRSHYYWEGRVHEIMGATVRADGEPVSKIRCDPSQLLVRHLAGTAKTRNYVAGLALQVLESPQKPRWWHYLGRELLYGRWYESAIAVLEAHARMEDAWITERSQSLCFIGECLEGLGRIEEAKENYRRAFELDSTRREPLLKLASTCSRRGDFDTAARAARQSLDIPRTNGYPELEANYTWVPHCLLYWNLFWLGRKEEARVHWDAFRSLAPEENMIPAHARMFPVAGVAPREAPSPQVAPGAKPVQAARDTDRNEPSKPRTMKHS